MNLIFLAKISKLQWSTWLILRIPFGHAAGCSNSKAQKDFQVIWTNTTGQWGLLVQWWWWWMGVGAGRGSVSVSGDKDVSSLPPHSSSHAGYALSGSELPKPSYSIWLTKSYVLRFISFCLLGFLFFLLGFFTFSPNHSHLYFCCFARPAPTDFWPWNHFGPTPDACNALFALN